MEVSFRNMLRCTVLFLLIILPVNRLYAQAELTAHRYVEDFKTMEYFRENNRSATWDTIAGEIRCSPFAIIEDGSYTTAGEAWGLTVSGEHIFAACWGSGLQVLKINYSYNPTFTGSLDTDGLAIKVEVDGDYAFVADYSNGLVIVDISDPATPAQAGHFNVLGNVRDVAIAGDAAFLAAYSLGLLIVDIEDPTSPTQVGQSTLPLQAVDVVVEGDVAFVCDREYGLRIIDISDLTNPLELDSYSLTGYSNGLAVSGNFCYVANYTSGLQVFDISDPRAPTLAATCDTPAQAWGVTIDGDIAYVSDGNSGLHAVDITDPTKPAIVRSFDTDGISYDSFIEGEFAYVADHSEGIACLRVKAALGAGPVVRSSVDTDGSIRGISVSGDYAYLANSFSYLQVVDISSPGSMLPVSSCTLSHYAIEIDVSGDYAYVATAEGMEVVDISDPEAPVYAGIWSPATNTVVEDIVIAGDYAYLAQRDSNLTVIDISDPTNPTFLSQLAGEYERKAVCVSGNYAYMADYYDGLVIVDIEDPANPAVAATLPVPGGTAYGVAVYGDYAYVGASYEGLQVVNITDPTMPSIVGSLALSNSSRDILIDYPFALVSLWRGGLAVVDISNPLSPDLEHELYLYEINDIALAGTVLFAGLQSSDLYSIYAYQDVFDVSKDRIESYILPETVDEVRAVRLTADTFGRMDWELTTSGYSYHAVSSGEWDILNTPYKADIGWEWYPVISHPDTNPTCTHLEIDWLFDGPAIDSIEDIESDQGKQVRLSWTRSGYDFPGEVDPVIEYAVFRRIDDIPVPPAAAAESRQLTGSSDIAFSGGPEAPSYPPGDWDYVTTVPGFCEDTYSIVVPTLADSSITGGMHSTCFFIRGVTASPATYYDSRPDSGYSVDNLEPHVPLGLSVAYNAGSGTALSWEECPDEDFQYFCVYRGEDESFVPGPGNLVHMSTGTEWIDTVDEGWRYFWKVTAVDFSGNESAPASAGTVTDDDIPSAPAEFVLYQNVPNPFNPVTVITFDLPAPSHVRLSVYDVKGGLVATLADRRMDAGHAEITWEGRDSSGQVVASGIYFYRLVAGDFRRTRKMVLLR